MKVLALTLSLALLPLAAGAEPLKTRPAETAIKAAAGLMLDVGIAGSRRVAVGGRGIILHSSGDQGWVQAAVPIDSTLTAVAFSDENRGWAVGHDMAILRTEDGAQTWQVQNFQPEKEQALHDVLVLNAEQVIAIGAYGTLMRTDDGGKTWIELEAPTVREERPHLNGIVRLGNGDLLIVGEAGLIARSCDGQGRVWERLASPYEASLFGAASRGAQGALVYGLRGNAFTSEDLSANSWEKLDTGVVSSLFGGAVLANGENLMVGADGYAGIVAADRQVRRASVESTSASRATGTLSAVVAASGGDAITVGEQGIARVVIAR